MQKLGSIYYEQREKFSIHPLIRTFVFKQEKSILVLVDMIQIYRTNLGHIKILIAAILTWRSSGYYTIVSTTQHLLSTNYELVLATFTIL